MKDLTAYQEMGEMDVGDYFVLKIYKKGDRSKLVICILKCIAKHTWKLVLRKDYSFNVIVGDLND